MLASTVATLPWWSQDRAVADLKQHGLLGVDCGRDWNFVEGHMSV